MLLKRISAFVCAAALGVSLVSCSDFKKTVEVRHDVSAPPKLVVMGDSIAAGYGLEGYSGNAEENYVCSSYANILGEKYRTALGEDCKHEMVNVAVSGDTSGDLLEHIRSGEFDAALEGSDAVVISIGGNDILHIFLGYLKDIMGDSTELDVKNIDLKSALGIITKMGDEMDDALEVFDGNLKEIISEVKKRTDGEIFFQTLYDPLEYYEDVPMLPGISAEKIGKLNDFIRQEAEDGGVVYYNVTDIYTEFKGSCGDLTNIKSYDIHPNAEGHELIAQILERDIGTKQYSYITEEEVRDEAAVKRFVLICGCCVLGGTAVIIAIVILRRKKG